MHIMPDTWTGLRQRYRLGRDPYDLHDNILAGAAYLRESTIATARRAFSLPITPALVAMRSILRPAALCLRKRSPMSRRLRRWLAAIRLTGVSSSRPVLPRGPVRCCLLGWSTAAPHPHIGRNRTIDRAHVRSPISPGSNHRSAGYYTASREAHRYSSRGLPALPRAKRRDRSGVQILKR